MNIYKVIVTETHTFMIDAEDHKEASWRAAEEYLWDGSDGEYSSEITTLLQEANPTCVEELL